MVARVGSVSARRCVTLWVKTLNQRGYFALFIETFFEAPIKLQRGFVDYVVSEVESDYFACHAKDEYDWADFVRNLLYYYSGNEEMKQPCKNDLARLINDFLKTGKAEESLGLPDDFMKDLEDI
jgi:hypothetical protein